MSRRACAGMLLLVAFAGCVDDGPHPDARLTPSPGSPAPDPPAGNDTGPPPEDNATAPSENNATVPADRPPSATLGAAPTQGTAPLTVRFQMDGKDPDGDALTWSLDADGDGSHDAAGDELPATYDHTFSAGDYTANLTVMANGTARHATVNISATAAPSPPQEDSGQTVDGEYVIAAEGCVAPAYEAGSLDGGAPAGDETDEVLRIQFDVAPGTIGKPWTATFTFDVGYLYLAVDFFDDEDALLQSTNTGQTPAFDGDTLTGTVPAGAAKGVLFACAGPTEAHVRYVV